MRQHLILGAWVQWLRAWRECAIQRRPVSIISDNPLLRTI